MKFSLQGQSLSEQSGIVGLMDDLGKALNVNPDLLFLGGGNPAQIPAFEQEIAALLTEFSSDSEALHKLVGVYQSPQGNEALLQELSEYLQALGWPVSEKNICVTSGSQSAFFMLINLFAGEYGDGSSRRICLPMVPEYLGYADQALSKDLFVSVKPAIDRIAEHAFKYRIDFERLNSVDGVGAYCVSRPANPSGNVVTRSELERLESMAVERDVPLIIDCAYGSPFPNIVYTDAAYEWRPQQVQVLSLSKLGLPGARTGIVVASEEVIARLACMNTVLSLANGNLGPVLMAELLKRKRLGSLCQGVIQPFYASRRRSALGCVSKYLHGLPYRVHEAEGAFFLWLWFEGLPISSKELYERLKRNNVLVMDGGHFFFGISEDWRHAQECLRISYCQSDEVLAESIELLGRELRAVYGGVRGANGS